MPKAVTSKASLAPSCHFRYVGSQALSNGFYFSPDHWSGGAKAAQNGNMHMLKHITLKEDMLKHIYDCVRRAV